MERHIIQDSQQNADEQTWKTSTSDVNTFYKAQ